MHTIVRAKYSKQIFQFDTYKVIVFNTIEGYEKNPLQLVEIYLP
jgi:hypothetical protein